MEHYDVIFTSNSTAALKLLGETFNFQQTKESPSGSYVYTVDNHMSVLGMREIVNTNKIHSIERADLLNNLTSNNISTNLSDKSNSSLVIFPAQSNFCGFKYPLNLIKSVQEFGLQLNDRNKQSNNTTNWYIGLDTACYVSTNPLDLKKYQPDFAVVSFYKMFGYPTGLGCLLVSKRGAKVLNNKKYYGGGTVKIALVSKNWHEKRDSSLHECFEDGTIPFLSILSVMEGFKTLERLVPARNGYQTMERISYHVFSLTKYFYENVSQLKHLNGNMFIRFYNETGYESVERQGGICTFLLLNDDGTYIGYSEFNHIAQLHNITVRTGCFCNPGICQRYLKLSDEMVLTNFQAGHICGDEVDIVNNVPTGAIRVSFGYMSTYKEVDDLIKVITDCFLTKRLRTVELHNGLNAIIEPSNQKEEKCPMTVQLKEINIFPVKSCGKLSVNNWPLTNRGLKYDREWLIVRSDGVVLTQKHDTRLCLITPTISPPYLILNFSGKKPCKVPLSIDTQIFSNISLCRSKVCNDNIEGVDCGNEVAQWLSEALHFEGLRLIKQTFSKKRFYTSKSSAEGLLGNKKEVTLANQAQFLVINSMSIKWLSKQVDDWSEIDFDYNEAALTNVIDRFRANLVIRGQCELEEIDYKHLIFADAVLEFDAPCTRCQMICINQEDGTKSKEPLRTLVRAFGGKMRFGVYFSLMQENFDFDKVNVTISCGDLTVTTQ